MDAAELKRRFVLNHPPFPMELDFRNGDYGMIVMRVVAQVFDRETGAPTQIAFQNMFSASAAENDERIFDCVRATLYGWIRHEIDECIMVDGERRFDPHVEKPLLR